MIIDKLSGSKVHFDVTVTKDQFEHGLDHAFEAKNKDVEIKGFRKGKAPRHVYEKTYGVESLYDEAIQHVLQETYYNAVVENDIEVVAQPKIDLDVNNIKRGEDFTYSVTVAVKPEIVLGEYKNIDVNVLPAEVSDYELEQEINKRLEQKAEMVLKEEGALENGDTAVFDFEGSVDGVKFDGGTAENYELQIGSGSFIPGFEDQMVGMKSEEEKDVVVTFPEDYHEKSLAGKEAVFKCKLHEIKTRQIPALDEDFITELNDESIKTVDDFKANLKAELLEQKKSQNQAHIRQSVINTAVENATFDLPEEMILEEANRSLDQTKQQIQQYGLDYNTYLQYMGKTEDEFKEELKTQAKKTLSEQLVIEAIAKAEKIEPTEEEIEAKYAEITDQYKAQNITLEQVKQAIPRSAVVSEIGYYKAIDLLLETAKVSE